MLAKNAQLRKVRGGVKNTKGVDVVADDDAGLPLENFSDTHLACIFCLKDKINWRQKWEPIES